MTKHCIRRTILSLVIGAWILGCGNAPSGITRSPVRINEVNPHNPVYQDLFGETGDWIELYNVSDEDFDLGGCYISDSMKRRFKDQFPSGYIVPAKNVFVMFADGEALKTSAIEPHLSFKLSESHEGIWLSDPTGYLIDSIEFSQEPPNDAGTQWTSLARFPDGTGKFEWCTDGTPEELNGDVCLGEVL
jgi:hypothetical protein